MREKADLRAYQDRSVTDLYEHDERQAVLPMGGGKTAVALTAARELLDDLAIHHVFVLAPKRVAEITWPDELAEWRHLQDTTMVVVKGSAAERRKLLMRPAEIHVVSIENIQWLVTELLNMKGDTPLHGGLLVIDEISRFKNPRSKRAKALATIRPWFRIMWGLTGTPRPNGYEDQFRPLSLLTMNKLWGKSFDKWRREHFYPADFHGYKWKVLPDQEQKLVDDINRVTFALAEEDMPEIPELATVVDFFSLPPEIERIYRPMERVAFSRLDSGRGIEAANMGVATGKLCQITQGFMYGDGNTDVEWLHALKTDWLVELDDSLDEPLLISYDFVKDLRVLRDLWPDMPWLGAGAKDAKNVIDAWNRGDLRRMALHPAAAGHGLNLQFGGSRLAAYGFNWSSELYDQMLKRFHRPGQQKRCWVHHCLARDTVDEMKYDRVHNKMSMQAAFNAYLRKV